MLDHAHLNRYIPDLTVAAVAAKYLGRSTLVVGSGYSVCASSARAYAYLVCTDSLSAIDLILTGHYQFEIVAGPGARPAGPTPR